MFRLVVSLGKWPKMVGETREHSKDIRGDFLGFVLGVESWKTCTVPEKGAVFNIPPSHGTEHCYGYFHKMNQMRRKKLCSKLVRSGGGPGDEEGGPGRIGRHQTQRRKMSPKNTRFRIKMTIMILMIIYYRIISFVTRNSPKHPVAH